MFKRVVNFGLIAVLAVVVGGCTSLVNSGLEQKENNQALQAGPSGPRNEVPAPYEVLARIAAQVPAFGGYFFGEDGRFRICLTDLRPEVLEAAKKAIAVFRNPEDRDLFPVEEAIAVKCDYSYLQLYGWYYRRLHLEVFQIAGVSGSGISDGRNRILVQVLNSEVTRQVEQLLSRLGIPREAVIIEEGVSIKPATHKTLQDKIRPVEGGLRISFIVDSNNCTLGYVAYSSYWNSNGLSFITNSHCTKETFKYDGTIMH